MKRIKAIGFDLDNTLIDRDAAFRSLISRWLKNAGLEGDDLVKTIIRMDESGYASREKLFRYLSELDGIGESWEELWQRFQQEFPNHFTPDPRLLRILRTVAGNYLIAILTNGGVSLQNAKIAAAELGEFFDSDSTFISSGVGFEKPDKRAFQCLTDRFGCPVGEILYVGDHTEKDMAGAKQFGMKTCWLRSGRVLDKEPQCDFTIETIYELPSILDS